MKKIIISIPNLLLSVLLCFVLSSCSSTGVKMSDSSPWKTIQFEDQANALDVDFIDDKNGKENKKESPKDKEKKRT